MLLRHAGWDAQTNRAMFLYWHKTTMFTCLGESTYERHFNCIVPSTVGKTIRCSLHQP